MHRQATWLIYTRLYTPFLKQRDDLTGWQRPTGCLKMRVIFRKSATIYGALLCKMKYEDKTSYGPSAPYDVQLGSNIWHISFIFNKTMRDIVHVSWHDSFVRVFASFLDLWQLYYSIMEYSRSFSCKLYSLESYLICDYKIPTEHTDLLMHWCCFYHFIRNSLLALLEALFAQKHLCICISNFNVTKIYVIILT